MVQPVPDVSDIWQRELPFAQVTVKDVSGIFNMPARTSSRSTLASSRLSSAITDASPPSLSIHPTTALSSATEFSTPPLSLPQVKTIPGRIAAAPPSPTKGSRRKRPATSPKKSKLVSLENDSSLSLARVPRMAQDKPSKAVKSVVNGIKRTLGRSNGAINPPASTTSVPELPSLGRALSGPNSPVLSANCQSDRPCAAVTTTAEPLKSPSPTDDPPRARVEPKDDAEPGHCATDAEVPGLDAERTTSKAGSVADKAVSIGTYTDGAWEEHGAARDITHDEGPELDLGMVVRGASLGVDTYTVEPVPAQPREAKRPAKQDQFLGRFRNRNDAWIEATRALGEGKLIHSRPVTPTGNPYKRARQ